MVDMKAMVWRPGDPDPFAEWRRTYSDHFPLWFSVTIAADDDADFDD
jgi:hypothetical protein